MTRSSPEPTDLAARGAMFDVVTVRSSADAAHLPAGDACRNFHRYAAMYSSTVELLADGRQDETRRAADSRFGSHTHALRRLSDGRSEVSALATFLRRVSVGTERRAPVVGLLARASAATLA